jgi:hypothetical protein
MQACTTASSSLLSVQIVGGLQLEATQTVAEIAGLLVSGAQLLYFIKRSIDTVDPGSDWPGPKAPPAGMALVAFFSLNIFIQSLRA